MMLFIDLRASPSGGIPAEEASLWDEGDRSTTTDEFKRRVRNRDLVLAAHGFNVGRAPGISFSARRG